MFEQPLIDLWLLRDYPDLANWIHKPSIDSLLTAGFPNVLVLVLPKAKVAAAMQFAEQELKQVWHDLSDRVFRELGESRWLREMQQNSPTWDGWLDTQWQTYWTGVPIGVEGEGVKSAKILQDPNTLSKQDVPYAKPWADKLNHYYGLGSKSSVILPKTSKSRELFQQEEIDLLRAIYESKDRKFSANIGSWWGYIFDTARINLGAVKNARTWQLPTVFSTRSTVSGIGAAVYPSGQNSWANEADVKEYWKERANLFNGSEQLNSNEVVKRGLQKILPGLLGVKQQKLDLTYPDLTAGVAGYLHTHGAEERDRYIQACEAVRRNIETEDIKSKDSRWGIPWAEAQADLKQHPPRLINASWLVEDFNLATAEIPSRRTELESLIKNTYPSNNPTDWYVLAAGDGDGMSDWLKGINMENYREYIPQALKDKLTIGSKFDKFLDIPKRMGPATHNALSRALLDFSNRLLPYLTQQRYAGRLIYGGGDDVLAYTNLWEWDKWVWDVRQCFRGAEDDRAEFDNTGDYWQWLGAKPPAGLTKRPLFTMGQKATISFGMTIAHQSTPMAIALEQLWEAEASAKKHLAPPQDGEKQPKDAIEIRVIYSNGSFPPTGHAISGAIRSIVGDRQPQIVGPFFCYEQSTLYFPRPLGFAGKDPLLPLEWVPVHPLKAGLLWDKFQPMPLVKSVRATSDGSNDRDEPEYRQYLPQEIVAKYLSDGKIDDSDWLVAKQGEDKPWTVEVRSHNSIEVGTRKVKATESYFTEAAIRLLAGWSIAIGLDVEIASPQALRLGGEGHHAILERCPELGRQWQEIQQISQQNFQQQQKAIAYLVTPGIFEMPRKGRSMCQAWPWEWQLAHAPKSPESPTDREYNLVGVATDKPVTINGRIRSKAGVSIPSPQMFAAPPGSMYYLDRPQELFTPALASRDVRRLGYSELLWLRFNK